MEDFDLRELFDYYLSKIRVILIFVIVGLVAGIYYTFVINTAMYKSSITYILSTNAEIGGTIDTSDISLNEKLIPTYKELVKSRLIIDKVISKLGLTNVSASELASMVSLEQVSKSSMITITVINSNPELAQKIASAIGEEFSQEVMNIYQINNIGVIDTPLVPTVPYNLTRAKDITTVTGISTFAVIVVLFIKFIFDKTVKYNESLPEEIGLPILGCIRNCNIKKGNK